MESMEKLVWQRRVIGLNLRVLRNRHNMTAQNLGDALNVSQQLISKLENAKSDLSYTLISGLIDVFGLTNYRDLLPAPSWSVKKLKNIAIVLGLVLSSDGILSHLYKSLGISYKEFKKTFLGKTIDDLSGNLETTK